LTIFKDESVLQYGEVLKMVNCFLMA
jgi:hypothetical protein